MSSKSSSTKAPKSTTPKVVEAEIVDDEPAEKRGWTMGVIFWGVLFIYVGTILLLNNYDVIDFNPLNLLNLWPVFIIGAGISLLPLRGWLANLTAVLLAIVTAGLIWVVAVDENLLDVTSPVATQVVEGKNDVIAKSLDISIKGAANDIALSSSADVTTYKATLTSRSMKLREESSLSGDTQRVSLETQPGSKKPWFDFSHRIALVLSRTMPTSLNVDTGASNLTGDLSEANLTALNVKAGASNVEIKLSGKAPLEVSIESGASNVELSLPRDAQIRVESEDAIGNVSLEGLDKKSDTVYETSGYNAAVNRVIVRVKMGISNLQIERY